MQAGSVTLLQGKLWRPPCRSLLEIAVLWSRVAVEGRSQAEHGLSSTGRTACAVSQS